MVLSDLCVAHFRPKNGKTFSVWCLPNHTSEFWRDAPCQSPLAREWLHIPSSDQTFLDETSLDPLAEKRKKLDYRGTSSSNLRLIQRNTLFMLEYQAGWEFLQISECRPFASLTTSSCAALANESAMTLQLLILFKSRFLCTLNIIFGLHAGSMAGPSH